MEKQNINYPPWFFCEGMEAMFVNGKKKIRVRITGMNPITAIDKEGIELMHYAEMLTPILPKLSFTPDMLKALLAGNKTQTTRNAVTKSGKPARRFKVGDVVGVGEMWISNDDPSPSKLIQYCFDGEHCSINPVAGTHKKVWLGNTKRNMGATLPTWAVRHLLRITNVELKRPCDFTDEEILKEGIYFCENDGWYWRDGQSLACIDARVAWGQLLQSIHKKLSDLGAFWNNEQIVYTFELIR